MAEKSVASLKFHTSKWNNTNEKNNSLFEIRILASVEKIQLKRLLKTSNGSHTWMWARLLLWLLRCVYCNSYIAHIFLYHTCLHIIPCLTLCEYFHSRIAMKFLLISFVFSIIFGIAPIFYSLSQSCCQ